MVYVAELARLAGRLDDATAARHATALASVGLPTAALRRGPFDDLLATMRVDKKARGAQLRFVVLDGLAEPAILAGPDESTCVRRTTALRGRVPMKVLVLNGPNLGRLGRRAAGDLRHHHPRRPGRAAVRTGGASSGSRSRCARPTTRASCSTGSTRPPTRRRRWCSTPAAWTHYSYALFDACAQLTAPLVELHISDPRSRPEEFRHHSVITPYAAKEIVGQGIDGYRQALEFLAGR